MKPPMRLWRHRRTLRLPVKMIFIRIPEFDFILIQYPSEILTFSVTYSNGVDDSKSVQNSSFFMVTLYAAFDDMEAVFH